MKKLSRLNLNQMKSEFNMLSSEMQHEIKGGRGFQSDCVAQAIGLAANYIGVSIDMDKVHNRAIDLIMGSGVCTDRASAKAYYNIFGLSNSMANSLINDAFAGEGEMGHGNGKTAEIAFIAIRTTEIDPKNPTAPPKETITYHAAIKSDSAQYANQYEDSTGQIFTIDNNSDDNSDEKKNPRIWVAESYSVNAVSSGYSI